MTTLNQKKVLNKIIDQMGNGGKISVSKAMRDSGAYSKHSSHHPEKITKAKGFIQILEKAGLTDQFLAKKHSQLSNATVLGKDTFYAEQIVTKVKGKKKETTYRHLSNDKIKELVEGTEENPTGVKIAYIKTFETHKDVFYRTPDNAVQSKALEMGYKIKDKFAADKLDITTHELTEEEENILKNIINKNSKK